MQVDLEITYLPTVPMPLTSSLRALLRCCNLGALSKLKNCAVCRGGVIAYRHAILNMVSRTVDTYVIL